MHVQNFLIFQYATSPISEKKERSFVSHHEANLSFIRVILILFLTIEGHKVKIIMYYNLCIYAGCW